MPNYDKNVVAVSRIVDIPEFLVVTTTNFNVKTVPELIEYAKKNPGKLRYGTVGAGSYPHYDMAFFAKKAGDLDMIAIHNKNGAVRRDQRHDHRRHPGRVPQRRFDRGPGSRPASCGRSRW